MIEKMLVIGIGNLYRGDDGAGRLAVRRIGELATGDFDGLESDGSAFTLMSAWENRRNVIILDALALPNRKPGEVVILSPDTSILKDSFLCSSHAFGLAEAIAMSRALGTFPENCKIIGIVGSAFAMSEQMTPEVCAAVEQLAANWPKIIQNMEGMDARTVSHEKPHAAN